MMSIASGSSGNCIYIGNDNTHILVDTGISRKRIEEGLNSIGLSIKDMSAVLITHEHSDHIGGLGVVMRKDSIPVYATGETLLALEGTKYLNNTDAGLLNEFIPDIDFNIGSLTIHPFSVSHDAANPCGYRIYDKEKNISVAVATDMGCYDDYTVTNLKGVNGIVLEANHDVRMLQTGSYPYILKQRILGNRGHLCNEASGQLLDEILWNGMEKVFLGHLSNENNYPELAFESVRAEIDLSDSPYKSEDFDIRVAKRNSPSELVEIL